MAEPRVQWNVEEEEAIGENYCSPDSESVSKFALFQDIERQCNDIRSHTRCTFLVPLDEKQEPTAIDGKDDEPKQKIATGFSKAAPTLIMAFFVCLFLLIVAGFVAYLVMRRTPQIQNNRVLLSLEPARVK